MRGLPRVIVRDHQDRYVCELDPEQVARAPYVAEVNGEHSVTITTTQELSKTDRLLVRDGMDAWHEYVVTGIGRSHAGAVEREYYCVWSLQYDLSQTFVNDEYGAGVVPGHESVPVAATVGLECALAGTSRWQIGTVDVTTLAAASFYRRSGWKALLTVIEHWGGELRSTITVSTDGTVARSVDLLQHVGKSTPTRRFDYGADVAGIRQIVSDDVWPCRIVPLGKSSETDAGGYTRRPGIASVNDGIDWVQNDAVVPYVRVPDGQGGYEYPMAIVENDTYEDPADVKAWAIDHLDELCAPKVTYEIDVVQCAAAGLHPHGVAEGDEVVVVDSTFGAEPLRVAARCTRVEGDLVDGSVSRLVVGNERETLGGHIADLGRMVAEVDSTLSNTSVSVAEYLRDLIEHINQDMNAEGGHWYLLPGHGSATYDVEVADPSVGAEASMATQITGGGIRIADSRTSSGDWDWCTLIRAGAIATELVTTARLIAGTIGNAEGDFFVDLDNDRFRIGLDTDVGATTMGALVDATQGNAADIAALADELSVAEADLAAGIEEARKVATNWMGWEPGTGLTIGASDSVIRLVLSNTRMVYRTASGEDLAWLGMHDDVWELHIETARILSQLRFGDFAWILRQNGNMTLKWIGA